MSKNEQTVTLPIKLTHDMLVPITRDYLMPFWDIGVALHLFDLDLDNEDDYDGYIHEGVKANTRIVTHDYTALVNNCIDEEGKYFDTRVWREHEVYPRLTRIMEDYSAAIRLIRKTHNFFKRAFLIQKEIYTIGLRSDAPELLQLTDGSDIHAMNAWIPMNMVIEDGSWEIPRARMDENYFRDHIPSLLPNYQKFMSRYESFYQDNIKPYKLLSLLQ